MPREEDGVTGSKRFRAPAGVIALLLACLPTGAASGAGPRLLPPLSLQTGDRAAGSAEVLPVQALWADGLAFVAGDPPVFDLRLGVLLQTDYRAYGESERTDDRFDVRRARFSLAGGIASFFRYRFEYEFQGNDLQNLIDAYGELAPAPWLQVRLGQFKVPFGFEWLTPDRDLPFAERTTAFDLGPGRDVGLMVHGGIGGELVRYAVGLFNGDGRDGSTRGSQEDAPELAGRLVLAPVAPLKDRVGDLRLGLSGAAARIDLADVSLKVKSVGMAGTNRNLYDFNSNTKFGVLRDAGRRYRLGLEAAWALGPVALFGEYAHLRYTDLQPAGQPARDADFCSWYAAAVWAVAAEPLRLDGAVLQPVRPRQPVGGGGMGALVAGVRLSRFLGDGDWIRPDAFVSVEEATTYTFALAWVLRRELRLLLDYSYTGLSDPLRVRVTPDGSVDYVDRERVLTARFQLAF